MRCCLSAILLVLLAAPVAAAPPPPPPQQPQQQQMQIPPELTNPKTAERIAAMSEALSKALLDLPVGEIQAAAEGRPATPADRKRTVRDIERARDPNFDRDIQRQIAEVGPQVQASMQAFARSLTAITQAQSNAADEIERAAANMPRPDYPRR